VNVHASNLRPVNRRPESSAADAAADLLQEGITMHSLEYFRDTRIPLVHGAGAVPAVGFGTLIADGAAARQAVKTALEVGFRHIDGAEVYRNEAIVGEALREAFEDGTVKREELFVTTKLWNNNHRPDRVKAAFEASLRRLQLDYLDCYLMHTPFAFQPGDDQYPKNEQGETLYDPGVTLLETWQAMERLVDEGRCRAIGLSDITLEKLKEIVAEARIKPAVVQVESHPYLPEWELLEFCQQHGIVLLAFAPLGHGLQPRITDDPVILGVAERIGKTPAQVALAWALQRGSAFLTTSTNPKHIRENFDIPSLPQDAMQEMHDRITTSIRLNAVVETGLPSFVPPPT
jgi:alcohol dehydrogenase (NADP+)